MSKRRILITGGSGFLGQHLAIKLLRAGEEVVLGSRNNGNNLIAELRTGCRVVPLDITNEKSVRDVIIEFKPDTIIHAAATKYVDISEKNPIECIEVNVLGSQIIARLALEFGISSVVGISTDKAAPPVGNIYGHSKAIMERLFSSLSGRTKTKFVCVRFGNIAWSTGSVFPLWERMTLKDKKVGTTGPQMRRFFFSVNEAADLVITAMNNIERFQGGILSLRMKSAQIQDILNVWSRIFKVPFEKVAERPGDKNDEVLIGAIELPFVEQIDIEGKGYFFINFYKKVKQTLPEEISSANADRLSEEEIVKLIESKPEL
jgi:UDP-N-acetylglucosamine 4,6-dehydratase/5-epimerase